MSEETKESGFFGQIKNQIITGVGVVITAAGGLVVSNMEAIFSPEKEEPQQVVVQDTTKTQQPVININIPEQKPQVQTIVKEVPAKTKPTKPTEKVYESW